MASFDLVVIGFGKAGKTLAARMAAEGKRVALIEKSPQMYGGTCINIGCIPTKTLLVAAEKGWSFEQAMAEKGAVTTRLNRKNHDGLANLVTLYDGVASFENNKTVVVRNEHAEERLTAETIVINTGAMSNWVPIEGLRTTAGVHDSTGIQNLARQPERLGIIGAGPIGLEFASFYAKLGTQVTVLDVGNRLLPNEEPTTAALTPENAACTGGLARSLSQNGGTPKTSRKDGAKTPSGRPDRLISPGTTHSSKPPERIRNICHGWASGTTVALWLDGFTTGTQTGKAS